MEKKLSSSYDLGEGEAQINVQRTVLITLKMASEVQDDGYNPGNFLVVYFFKV
jgi:hypothetical protein